MIFGKFFHCCIFVHKRSLLTTSLRPLVIQFILQLLSTLSFCLLCISESIDERFCWSPFCYFRIIWVPQYNLMNKFFLLLQWPLNRTCLSYIVSVIFDNFTYIALLMFLADIYCVCIIQLFYFFSVKLLMPDSLSCIR